MLRTFCRLLMTSSAEIPAASAAGKWSRGSQITFQRTGSSNNSVSTSGDVASQQLTTENTHRMSLNEVNGDLFTSTDSLVHCVSRDLHMGKGIATEFKKRFGGVSELKEQNAGVGDLAVLSKDNRYIYYLVTKERYFHKPTIETLRGSLLKMRTHCLDHNVTRLSMPRIGCGLDKLDWNDVSRLIEDTFTGTNINVTIYVK